MADRILRNLMRFCDISRDFMISPDTSVLMCWRCPWKWEAAYNSRDRWGGAAGFLWDDPRCCGHIFGCQYQGKGIYIIDCFMVHTCSRSHRACLGSNIVVKGIILYMCPANERWCYIVTSSLIGWAHAQNDPCGYKLLYDHLSSIIVVPVQLWMQKRVDIYHRLFLSPYLCH